MLAPRTSSAFVCLRCELRLTRLRPSLAPRPLRASFSTSIRRQDAFDDAEAASRAASARADKKPSAFTISKIRKRRGKAIKETTAPLAGVKTLGKDAGILVLQEMGGGRKETEEADDTGIPDAEVELSSGSPSILSSLQAESAVVGQEEVNRQLDSIRPQNHGHPGEPQYLNRKSYQKLAQVLTKGFTVQQLSRYLSATKKLRSRQDTDHKRREPKRELDTAKLPVSRTQWQSSYLSNDAPIDNTTVKNGQKRKHTTKRTIIDQILRQAWHITLLEEVDSQGSIELQMKSWQLELLNTGDSSTALDSIGKMRNARVEINWPDHTLRITADKSSAEYAADDVEARLNESESYHFRLEPWRSSISESRLSEGTLVDLIPKSAMATVGKATRTTIEDITHNTIIIRGLTKVSIEEARRALLDFVPVKVPLNNTVDIRNVITHGRVASLQAVHSTDSLVSSRDSNQGRWTVPVGTQRINAIASAPQPSDQSISSGSLTPADALDIEKSAIAHMRPGSKDETYAWVGSGETRAVWSNEVEDKVAADFGQVMFPLGATDPKSVQMQAADHELPFLKTMTGFPTLALNGTLEHVSFALPESLEYELMPSPDQENALPNYADYPRLTLRFQASPQPRLRAVALTFGGHQHHVLLPGEVVDIKFKKQKRIKMRNPMLDPSIKAFAEAVIANIESGARLTSPPSLEVTVPRWTIPGYDKSNKGTRKVTYLSSGIKHRQTLISRFDDQTVSYCVQQRGKLGGMDHSLSLYYSPFVQHTGTEKDGVDPVGDEEEALSSFVKTSLRLAGKITEAAANTTPLGKQERPRDLTSSRKLRRNAEAAARQAVMGEFEDRAIPEAPTGLVDGLQAEREQETSADFEGVRKALDDMDNILGTAETAASREGSSIGHSDGIRTSAQLEANEYSDPSIVSSRTDDSEGHNATPLTRASENDSTSQNMSSAGHSETGQELQAQDHIEEPQKEHYPSEEQHKKPLSSSA